MVATLAWKSGGLDTGGLNATVGPSTMTLGGKLKHLAGVEDYWFARRLHGRDAQPPSGSVDWKSDPDWEWQSPLTTHPSNSVPCSGVR